eukprot:g19191.t1
MSAASGGGGGKAVVAQNFPASWAPQHKRMAFMASGMFFCIDFRLLQLHWRYCLRRCRVCCSDWDLWKGRRLYHKGPTDCRL